MHRADGCSAGRWRVKNQLGRRAISGALSGKATNHLQATHFQRTHALAQRGFQCIFPALLHMQAAPQALQAVQTMFGQPRQQLAISLDLFLHGFERIQARSIVSVTGRFGVDGLLPSATVFVQLGHLLLQVMQAGVGLAGNLSRFCQLLLHALQTRFVRASQSVFIHDQALPAQIELAALFLNVALIRCQYLDLLLDLHHTRTLLVGFGLAQTQGVFQVGQHVGLFFNLRSQQLGLFGGAQILLGQGFNFNLGILLARGPPGGLLSQLAQALLDTLAALHYKAYLGFQAAYLRTGFVQLAL